MNKNTGTKLLTLFSIIIITLSILATIAGAITFFSLSKLSSNLPVDSINKFRNIANLQSLVAALSSDMDSLQADKRDIQYDIQQDIDWDELKFTINKIKVSQTVIIDDFKGNPPNDLRMILDEISLVTNNIETTMSSGNEKNRTDILLSHNEVNYIFSELRDYIVRNNNAHFWILERQRAGIGTLKILILIFSTLALCGAALSVILLKSRKKAVDQLIQARETALAASKAKGEFLSNISHEIRTPMNAIMGLSYLALKTDLSPSQRDYVRRIQNSGQHLLGIINDVLDFSKIEAGRLSLEAIPFELDKVLDTVANLIMEKASGKGLELIFDVEKTIPTRLIGDPLRLGQILINLANNAVKFTEKGEISIQVRLKDKSSENVMLYFEVKDTGIGITDEQKKRLFQSFEQADTSTTRQFGGSGLGLVISKNLVELMGGEIGVESVYKEGSTFWFTAQMGRDLLAKPIPRYSVDLKGKKVLVVDDNDHSRKIIAEMLTTMGFMVVSTNSGMCALEEIKAAAQLGEHYEIIFLDWKMPEMNGIDTARGIKALRLSPEPHLVIITSYGREEVVQEAESEGIKTILVKPISASVLFDTSMQLLHLASAFAAGHAEVIQEKTIKNEPIMGLDGIKILLVEDNRENQLVATEILQSVGCRVTLASDGLQAIERLKSGNTYDIVLMDMQMPVLDGLSATREIRKMPDCASLPIIAMTANAMNEEKEKCLHAGINDYITKPIDPPILFETLLRFAHAGPIAAAPIPTVSASSLQTGQEIPEIPGIEIEKSLSRMMNNKDLYLQLLRLFTTEQCAAVKKIQSALETEDMKQAELIAHTLKGSAAIIGAVEIQSAAENLERSIRQKEENFKLVTETKFLEPLLADTIARINTGILSLESSTSGGARRED